MGADSAPACVRSPGVISIASELTTVRRPECSGANSAAVPGSAAASFGSISTATTSAPASRSPSVSDPSPGPTSITVSPGSTPPARAILRTVPGSTTKFCPSTFVGRISNRCARLRTSEALRRRVVTNRTLSHFPQHSAIHAPHAGAARQAEGDIQLGEDVADHLRDALLARDPQPIGVGPADGDDVRAERERDERFRSRPHSGVEHDGRPAADPLDDFGQHVEGGYGGVDLPPAVVRYPHP